MKKFIVIAVMVGIMAMFTACGEASSKDHTGHLIGREPVKTDMFDGALLMLK
jgi:hypothetical protein